MRDQMLRDSGAGISARQFVEHALFPTLRVLGTSRAELKAAIRSSIQIPNDVVAAAGKWPFVIENVLTPSAFARRDSGRR
jgi:hypothetical protein